MSIEETLKERNQTHGAYTETALVSQILKATVRSGPSWLIMNPSQRESVDMILHKIARVVCGNPNEPDHWVDIQGYAKLAEGDK